MSRLRRRRVLLASAAGLGAVLAGCSSGPSDSDSTDNPAESDDGFRAVRTEGMVLVVELGATTADSVSVVAPDGTSFAEEPVQAGVSKVEIPLGTSYEPGEFRVLGVADSETVAEARIEIRLELEIVEVGVGANHLDRMPSELGSTAEQEALVRVRNTGTGPQQITQLAFLGQVPNPEPTPSDPEESGIFNQSEGRGSAASVSLPVGEEVTLFSSSLPFSFEGDGVDCRPEPMDAEFTVAITGDVGPETLTQVYTISYTASETYDGCSVTIPTEDS